MSKKTDDNQPIAKQLDGKLDAGVRHHQPLVANTELTLAFLNGNQYVKYVKGSGISPIANKLNELRVVDNKMLPAHRFRRAQFFKTKPVISALEGGYELADVERAYAASKICEFWRSNTAWLDREKEAFAWMDVSGLSFIAPVWRQNPFAFSSEEVIEFDDKAPEDPQGIIDFVKKTEKQVPDEDIAFDVFHSLQTFCFPLSATSWDKVTAIMTADIVSDDWIDTHLSQKMKWEDMGQVDNTKLNYDAIERVNNFVSAEFGYANPETQNEERYLLIQYRERPTAKNPNGRYVLSVGGVVYEDDDLPYVEEARMIDPRDEFNITMGMIPWFSMKIAGRLIPPSPMELLRKAQTELNDLLTDEANNRKSVGRNKVVVEQGTLNKDQWTGEHGEVVELPAGTTVIPQLVQGQPLVGIGAEIGRKEKSIDDASGRTAMYKGENLPQVRSAFHLSILEEASSTIPNDEIRDREKFHELVAKFALALAQKRMPKSRVIEICGDDAAGYALMFLSGNIRTDIRVQEGSAVPRNQAAREAKLQELLQYGAFVDKKTGQNNMDLFWRMMQMGTMNKNYDKEEKQRQRARNENYLMLMKIVIQPWNFEDHAIHIEECLDFMARPEFYRASRASQGLFQAHLNMHRDILMSQNAPEAFMQGQELQPGVVEGAAQQGNLKMLAV